MLFVTLKVERHFRMVNTKINAGGGPLQMTHEFLVKSLISGVIPFLNARFCLLNMI